MIASISGTVAHLGANYAVVDVSGVGYRVQLTPTHSLELRHDDEVTIVTALIVRDDALELFGFRSFAEREIFDHLTSVSGVGPKSALNVLAHLTPEQLATAIESENAAAFKPVPGVGPKTAKLIILHLKGKLAVVPGSEPTAPALVLPDASAQVVDALVELGTQQKQAESAVAAAAAELEGESDVSTLLRAALRELGRGGARR